MALAYETACGTPPVSGFRLMPFARKTLGSEQPLLESELLGYGGDPLAPTKDAVNADGEVVIPIDIEVFGFRLKAAFAHANAVFENLLPDNIDLRRRIAGRTAARSDRPHDLLAAIGRDGIGAMPLLPQGKDRNAVLKRSCGGCAGELHHTVPMPARQI